MFIRWNILELHFFLLDFMMQEVMADLDVFGSVVKLWVLGNGYGRLIVHEECSWVVVRESNFS